MSEWAIDRIEQLTAERDALRAGKCLGTIPGAFIACGEGGNYCSTACELRALVGELADALCLPCERENPDLIARAAAAVAP